MYPLHNNIQMQHSRGSQKSTMPTFIQAIGLQMQSESVRCSLKMNVKLLSVFSPLTCWVQLGGLVRKKR